jgi:hypothetical protein
MSYVAVDVDLASAHCALAEPLSCELQKVRLQLTTLCDITEGLACACYDPAVSGYGLQHPNNTTKAVHSFQGFTKVLSSYGYNSRWTRLRVEFFPRFLVYTDALN